MHAKKRQSKSNSNRKAGRSRQLPDSQRQRNILTISTEKQPAKQTKVRRIRKLTSETHIQTFYKEGDSPNGMSSSNLSSQSSWDPIKVEVEREEESEEMQVTRRTRTSKTTKIKAYELIQIEAEITHTVQVCTIYSAYTF